MQFYIKIQKPKNTLAGIFVAILTILHSSYLQSYTNGEDLSYPDYSFAIANPDGLEIASKKEEDINKAPSIVTVIMAKEIEDMGARTITDVLRTVPGFDIVKDAAIGFEEVGTRGVQRSSEGIKVYIDDHSINSPLDGQAFIFFDDLSLRNVKRIGVIRGPGSALYGANTFSTVKEE